MDFEIASGDMRRKINWLKIQFSLLKGE